MDQVTTRTARRQAHDTAVVVLVFGLAAIGCKVETPYYHLPQGYSDTYRKLLVEGCEPSDAAFDASNSLMQSPSTSQMSFESDPDDVAPVNIDTRGSIDDRPKLAPLRAVEATEPSPVAADDRAVVLPPAVERAPSLLPTIPTKTLFDFDLLPPLP